MASGNAATADIPIDIFYSKLSDWLVDRKWTKPDFREKSGEIRKLITAAIQDMPDMEEITKMLTGTYITYYHCKRIVELLKVSEADTKSFFGSYSSKRMTDWVEVIKQYEADNCFLGECSRILQHNVTYEVPALKRKIAANQSKITDSHQKEKQLRSKAVEMKAQFQQTCKDMGIKGGDIVADLVALRADLAPTLRDAATKFQTPAFNDAIEYYRAFMGFTLEDETAKELLPLLAFINKHGNASCHFYTTGIDFGAGGSGGIDFGNGAAAADTGGIDFGDIGIDFGDAAPVDTGGIDFGDDSGGGIDFGDGAADTGGIDFGDGAGGIDFGDGTGGIDFGDGAGGIDFGDGTGGIDFGDGTAADTGGIDFGDGGSGIDFGDGGDGGIDFGDGGGISVEGAGMTAVAVKSRKLMLEETETRNMAVDQLLQLEGFLMQRVEELSATTDITSINQFAGAPPIVSMGKKEAAKLLVAVSAARGMLMAPRTQQLIFIYNSAKYVERLAATLEKKKKTAANLIAKADKLIAARTAAEEEITSIRPKLDTLTAQTKVLQKEVESSIGKLYDGRKVNIIGAINALT